MVSLLPFGNVLVPATVLFSGGEFINLALCVRILDNHTNLKLRNIMENEEIEESREEFIFRNFIRQEFIDWAFEEWVSEQCSEEE